MFLFIKGGLIMICPFMSFNGYGGLKECEKENCALYNESFKACSFLTSSAALNNLANAYAQTTAKTLSGNRVFCVNR